MPASSTSLVQTFDGPPIAHKKHVTPEVVGQFLEGLTNNMVVVLPSTCVQDAGLTPNINDKHKPKQLWIGRLRDLAHLLSVELFKAANEPREVKKSLLEGALEGVENRDATKAEIGLQYAQLPPEKLVMLANAAIVIQKNWRRRRVMRANSMDVLQHFAHSVIKGVVVLLCGSTGIAGDSLRYMRMLAGMGYLVMAPDDFAKKSDLKHREPRPLLRPEEPTDYWERNLMYRDAAAKGEMVYESSTNGFIENPEQFDQLYNNIITVRQAELAFTLRRLPQFCKRQGVFLFGMSEGSIVLSTFNDESFADILRGRILASYSLEQNYWNYHRPEDVGLQGRPDVPTLNMMGFDDEYFGAHNSIAAKVAEVGGMPVVVGHAFDALLQRGVHWGLVLHFEGAGHNLTLTHDDVIREVLNDFLARPQYATRHLPLLWSRFPALQDAVTRVRRSNDNSVLYVRIRIAREDDSDASRAAMSGIQPRNIPALFSTITNQLFELQTVSSDAEDGDHDDMSQHGDPGEAPWQQVQAAGASSQLWLEQVEAAGLFDLHRLAALGCSPPASRDEGGHTSGRDRQQKAAMAARLLVHTTSSPNTPTASEESAPGGVHPRLPFLALAVSEAAPVEPSTPATTGAMPLVTEPLPAIREGEHSGVVQEGAGASSSAPSDSLRRAGAAEQAAGPSLPFPNVPAVPPQGAARSSADGCGPHAAAVKDPQRSSSSGAGCSGKPPVPRKSVASSGYDSDDEEEKSLRRQNGRRSAVAVGLLSEALAHSPHGAWRPNPSVGDAVGPRSAASASDRSPRLQNTAAAAAASPGGCRSDGDLDVVRQRRQVQSSPKLKQVCSFNQLLQLRHGGQGAASTTSEHAIRQFRTAMRRVSSHERSPGGARAGGHRSCTQAPCQQPWSAWRRARAHWGMAQLQQPLTAPAGPLPQPCDIAQEVYARTDDLPATSRGALEMQPPPLLLPSASQVSSHMSELPHRTSAPAPDMVIGGGQAPSSGSGAAPRGLDPGCSDCRQLLASSANASPSAMTQGSDGMVQRLMEVVEAQALAVSQVALALRTSTIIAAAAAATSLLSLSLLALGSIRYRQMGTS